MFFNSFPINYDEPLFRPPSEAESLILQITFGCTWNKCAFCEMYTSKKFSIKKDEDIIAEINAIARIQPGIRKIFLADGNPMALSSKKLLIVLNAINTAFPRIRRVSTYANPKDILSKTTEELKELKNTGLKLIYVGIETGDNELLKIVNKGETPSSITEGLLKARKAGIKLSVMFLNGLGGLKYSEQHAINSAKILNQIQPQYASVLVLSFPFGLDHYIKRFNGDYVPMNITDLLKEMELFISNTELQGTIFRSNHASNYLVLSGILPQAKNQFLGQIRHAIQDPDTARLREEWQRGL
ncbi:MAG: radical SAM protein [Bacteroidota bacterium]